VTITTPGNLIIQGGAVTVFSLGEGDAGNLEVVAGSIRLDEKGLLNAGAPLSNGGNITLQVQDDLLLMRHNSQISTSAGTPQKGGNGGNITIKAPLIVAVPSENSDITARAVRGRGGNINITALGIYGIESRQELTPLSDINASSDYGVNGTVQINTLVIDPGLAELPTDLVDAEELVTAAVLPLEVLPLAAALPFLVAAAYHPLPKKPSALMPPGKIGALPRIASNRGRDRPYPYSH
jgi:large exoprotein involved in heme utilization and adhesion